MVLLRTRDPKEPRVARVGSARLPDGEVEPVFTSRLEKVVVNGAIDESLFALPAPPPAPAEPLPWASPSPSSR